MRASTRVMQMADKLETHTALEDRGFVGGPCRVWQKSKNLDGYGSVWNGRYMEGAHRAAYREFVGPIPEGMKILHKCDQRDCVEKSHLYVGTQAQNIQDMHDRGRYRPLPREKAQCRKGHQFSETGASPRADGRLRCLECARIRDRNRRSALG